MNKEIQEQLKQAVAKVVDERVMLMTQVHQLVPPRLDNCGEAMIQNLLNLLLAGQAVCLMALRVLLLETEDDIEIPQAFLDAFSEDH